MTNLDPSQVFSLAVHAYDLKNGNDESSLRGLRMAAPFVDMSSVKQITATSGIHSSTLSGFGFIAQLNGGRSTEIVIATRGTASMADVGTDLNAIPTRGPTGHLVHKGFSETFRSYVQQINHFLDLKNLGFKPTAVHCVGHSLGGALANMSAAACAELGMNAYLYTVAAPRVGMVPFAEHLSKKMNAQHVYRVANEADIVTMVPSYPYVHSPYVHGTYLLDGGLIKINPLQHMLANGYASMLNTSWPQMASFTQGKQQQLANSMFLAGRPDAKQFEQMLNMPGAMFSGRMLKIINMAINDMLNRLGAQSLLCVNMFGSGAFTVMDQLAEIMARYAQASSRNRQEMVTVLNAVMAYLGRVNHVIADTSMRVIRWVFALLYQSIFTMVRQAIYMTIR